MVVGVKVCCQRNHDRAAKPTVDMVGHNTFQYRSLEDAMETAIVAIEVILAHRILLGIGFRRCTDRLGRSRAAGCGSSRLLRGGLCSCWRWSGTFKINRNGIAVDSVLLLLLLRKLPLLGLGLGLRHIGGMLRSIGAAAVDRIALRGGHRRSASGLRAGSAFGLLELLERSGKLLLVLTCLGVPLRLQLLLRLE